MGTSTKMTVLSLLEILFFSPPFHPPAPPKHHKKQPKTTRRKTRLFTNFRGQPDLTNEQVYASRGREPWQPRPRPRPRWWGGASRQRQRRGGRHACEDGASARSSASSATARGNAVMRSRDPDGSEARAPSERTPGVDGGGGDRSTASGAPVRSGGRRGAPGRRRRSTGRSR